MKFDTGRFLIKNADSGNLAVLPDANQGTDLVGAIPGLDDNLKGEKWNIVLLSTKKFNKYKIQNFDFAGFASCDTRPDPGHSVRGKTGARQWTIKETNRSAHYTISTGNDPELFWGLPDDEDGTPVELSDKGNDPHNHWTFERVSDLDDCVRDMAGDSRSQCLKALSDFPSLAAAQLDAAIKEGGLTAVIKLLSDSDTVIQSTASTTLTTLAFTVFPHIVVDLYEWKSITSQTRALQKIIDFALADQIKAAAVGSNLIPHLVRLLDSVEDAVVGKSLEALTVLMSLPAARTAAHEAQVGPVLKRLAASASVVKDAAGAVIALGTASHPATPPTSTLAPRTDLDPLSASSTDSLGSAKQQSSNNLAPPLDSDTLLSAPSSYNNNASIISPSQIAAVGDQGDLDSSIARRGSVTSLKTGISEPEDTTMPTYPSIATLVAYIQGPHSAMWGVTARVLRDATQDDAEAQNLAFALGAVPALVEILISDLSDNSLLGYVVEALGNIVVVHDDAKISAVESGVFPPLIRLLDNSTVCGKAVIVLLSLSRNALGQVASEAAGALPALVMLLKEGVDDVVRIKATQALTNLSRNDAVKEAVWEAGPFPHLVGMLYSLDTTLHPSSTDALWSLSAHIDARADIGTHVSRFAELLASDQLIVRTNAAGVLSNICAETELKDLAIKADVIPPLVQLIQSTEDLITLNNGMSSLSGLSVLPIAQTTLALSGCVPVLVKFLDSDDISLRRNSAITIRYISRCKEGQQAIAEAGGIPPLVKLLSDKDKELQQRAALALWHIHGLDTAVRKESIRAGCLPPLIKLLDSDHIPSRMPAAAALWNIFLGAEAQRMGIELQAIPPLLRLMNNAEMDWSTRTKAAGALRRISSPQDGKIALAVAGGIESIITCLNSVQYPPKETTTEREDTKTGVLTEEEKASKQKKQEIARNSFSFQLCAAMWSVTFLPENQIQALNLGAIPTLIPLLYLPALDVCAQAAGALANIACTQEGPRQCQHSIPPLVNLLQLGDRYIEEKIQAARCLAIVTDDLAMKRSAVLAVPGLVKLLQSDNAVAINQAAMAIKSIVVDSSVRSVARANGVVEVLERLVSRYVNDTNTQLKNNLESALSSMS